MDGESIRDLDPLQLAVTYAATVGEQFVVLLVRRSMMPGRFVCRVTTSNPDATEHLCVLGHPGDAGTNWHVLDAPPAEIAHRVNQELFMIGSLFVFEIAPKSNMSRGHGSGAAAYASSIWDWFQRIHVRSVIRARGVRGLVNEDAAFLRRPGHLPRVSAVSTAAFGSDAVNATTPVVR